MHVCMYICMCMYVCVCTTDMSDAYRGQNKALDSLELTL